MHDSPFGPVALTPVSFLDRAAVVFGERTGFVDDERRFTYAELGARARNLAGGLANLGVEPGDRVSVLSPNTVTLFDAHFGVPGAGAVLNALNTRLSAVELTYIVEHAGSKVLIADHELADLAQAIASKVGDVRVIAAGTDDSEYESLLASSAPLRHEVENENGLLSLNYTSGTTGRPKGVMYSHRGAFLQAMAMVAAARLSPSTVSLWTLPMFHCNGWCFPWAVTAAGAVHVGLRRVAADRIWHAIRDEGVNHFNAAPTVLIDLAYSDAAGDGAPERIHIGTGGAPPSPTLLSRLDDLHISVTHLYGLTETYGPSVVCEWWPEWDDLDADERARRNARQGVANLVGNHVRVVGDDGHDVPADGTTRGEVLLRGNNVMLGYYRDPEATAAACLDGWFRTGDSGVLHPDGYIELGDRIKDVIISGGENIASIEVEQALAAHPAVLECAVVAAPHERWGEVPVAFVTLRSETTATEVELIEFVQARIARFKAPNRIRFEPLPKTATGKIQKFVLRQRLGSP